MIREILGVKDQRLRQPSKPVKKMDKKILSIIEDLKETLAVQNDPEGIGLAAPQIGKNVRVFVIKPNDSIQTIINPEIITVSKEKTRARDKKGKAVMEGCLSLPHFYGPIKRGAKIKIKYLDEEGKLRIKALEGLEAQIIQHEIDHLNGILFIDRLLEQKKPLYEYKDGEWERVEI